MISVEKAVELYLEYRPQSIVWRVYKSCTLQSYIVCSNHITIDNCFDLINFDGLLVHTRIREIKKLDAELVYEKRLIFAFAKQWRDLSKEHKDCFGGIALCDDGSLYQITYMEGFDYASYIFLQHDYALLNEVVSWLNANKAEIESMPDCIDKDLTDDESESSYYELNYMFFDKKIDVYKPYSFEIGNRYLRTFLNIVQKYFPEINSFKNW